jgi:hypothetical protein
MDKKRTLRSLQPPRHLRQLLRIEVRDGGGCRRDGETQRKIERSSRRACPRTVSPLPSSSSSSLMTQPPFSGCPEGQTRVLEGC